MDTKVQLVLDRVAKEPTFAQSIIKDPQVTLAPYRLSPEEFNKVLTVVKNRVPGAATSTGSWRAATVPASPCGDGACRSANILQTYLSRDYCCSRRAAVRRTLPESELPMKARILRGLSMVLLLPLLLVLVASCGGDALRQCEEAVLGLEAQNAALQQTLSDAKAESDRLRQELGQPEPDLSSMRESLWLLFHDEAPALWACDETASQVVPVDEMPSASPEGMISALNERFQALNPALESPALVLEGMDGDTAVVSLGQARVVTEQMGSTGAQCYFAGVTFSLTSFKGIDHVRFEIEEGNHGGPGRYDRADFVHYLPLELGQP